MLSLGIVHLTASSNSPLVRVASQLGYQSSLCWGFFSKFMGVI